MAISEALVVELTFLEGQHPFVPALIKHFPSSPTSSLTSYAREFWLAALEQNSHNCLGVVFVVVVFFFFLWVWFLPPPPHPVNLPASLAGDVSEECMSASAPEQLRVPVSRAAGRCWAGSSHPACLVWQLYDTTDSNGVSVEGSQFNRAQSPAGWWAAMDAVAAQGVPGWQIKSSILGLSADQKRKGGGRGREKRERRKK